MPEKSAVRLTGVAESGPLNGAALVAALNLLAQLPPSDAEKAEAVRRLLRRDP